MTRYIITSALPYAEGMLHLGNLVGSILPADIYYKYLKMKGEDALYICGSDQHGTPIELQAIKKGVEPRDLANQMHEQIKQALEKFECTFTYYGKTDSEANKATVYEIFDALDRNGYIIETESLQAYCNIDKRFLSDRFVEGTCPYCGFAGARGDQCDNCGHLLTPQELKEPHCVICGSKELEFKKVKNLAIDLKKLAPKLKSFIEERSKNNWSKNSINKSLSYISQGLQAREITRNMKWGFKVPKKGFEDSVFYVWFDAPIGYIGITREYSEKMWKDYWFDEKSRLVQFMGKDNIEFHTLMWPGMLIGSDLGYVLPYTIKAYEFLMSKTIKFSKSRGTGMNIQNALDIMHPDYWRFVLASLMPETADSEFSIPAVIEIVNKVMNDKIGNLVHRVLTLAKKVNDGKWNVDAPELDSKRIMELVESYRKHFENLEIREALKDVVDLADLGNMMMSSYEPWSMLKSGKNEELNALLSTLLSIVFYIGVLLHPFTPMASAKTISYFGLHENASFNMLNEKHEFDASQKIEPIFRKMTDHEIKKLEGFSAGM